METAIEVRRDDTGTYAILGAAEPEDWHAVRTEMESVEPWGSLLGWEPWRKVYRAVDMDGLTRWYFIHDNRGRRDDD